MSTLEALMTPLSLDRGDRTLSRVFEQEIEHLDKVENSKLISYVIRYNIMFISRYKKNVFLIWTDKFLNFLPQLNDKFVAENSFLAVENPLQRALARSKLQCVNKKMHLIEDDEKFPDMAPHSVIFFSSSSPATIDNMKLWKKLKAKRLALFIPCGYAEKMQRLCHEVGAVIQISRTLDVFYHENKKMSAFIKSRLKHSLTEEQFAFLAQIEYMLVDL
jgi:hypothetical protein